MCIVCIMLDKSLASPKSLVNTIREIDITEEHKDEVIDKAIEIASTKENADLYIINLLSELEEDATNATDYIDFLRNT